MKLPSISQAASDAREAFARFPFVILDAMLGTICALILIDHTGPTGPTVLIQIVFGAVLGFPLLAGLAITSEKWKWGRSLSLALQMAAIILVGCYAMTIPQDFDGAPNIHIFRLLMLTAGMVLFVFGVPYLRHESELGYWNFCKTLCIRAVIACVYAVVLYGGLAIALAALDKLFGVDIPGKRYAELWVLINGVFTTWFFLAGIPKDLERLDGVTEYPKSLRIFCQYILLPLVLVYLVILYAYLGKILLAWDWPQGWVSGLILGFVATGIVSMLLLHPIRERSENRWVTIASRWFYVIIIPLIVMLFLAIWRRVSEYGITEIRYLGLAAVVWLCIITSYFIFSRKKRILFLASSLCLEVLVVSVGPWGMFAVSERSQVARLETLLIEHHILVGGRVQSAHDSLRFETTKQISSIIGYLGEVHGYDAIQPWFGESLKQDPAGKRDAYKDPGSVAKLMGVEYVQNWQASMGGTIILKADEGQAMNIEGYDHLLQRRSVFKWGAMREFAFSAMTLSVGEDLRTMTVRALRDGTAADSSQIDLKPMMDTLVAEYGNTFTDKIPPEKMTVTAIVGTMQIKVFFSTLTIERREPRPKVTHFEFEIAYKYHND